MKMTRLVALSATLLIGLMGQAAKADWNDTISAAAPLHWFNFNETTGTTIDDSGSANVDGTVMGAVGLGAAGAVGGAATFDGASYVLVGGPNLATPWTLESIFLADPVNGGPSMGLIGADFDAAERMAVKADQWNKTGQMGYTVFGVVDVTLAGATPTDFEHVVLVGTDAGVELFVNGASVASDATATFLSRHLLGAGAVRSTGALVDGLTGTIDEIVIYDRALSAAEISSHYASVPEPASATLLLVGSLAALRLRRRES
ncbi:MAG: hypothetical protein KDB23_04555 [Planctomycetales bacterium]|nr:hypothetical protein [Planctomycetales bacterium]